MVIFTFLATLMLLVIDAYFNGDARNGRRMRIDLHGLFTTGVLLGQCLLPSFLYIKKTILKDFFFQFTFVAGFFTARKFKMRIVGGAWCLTAFVLVTAYSSVLISFIAAPVFYPLVDSVGELADRNDVSLVILKNYATDVILSVCWLRSKVHTVFRLNFEHLYFKNPGNDTLLKKLSKKLNSNPHSRCTNISHCYNQVRMGKTVFIQVYDFLFMKCSMDIFTCFYNLERRSCFESTGQFQQYRTMWNDISARFF